MKKLFVAILLAGASMMALGEKISYQNWVADLNGKTNEAYTIADANTSFGVFCSSGQCLFYLHHSLNCTPGAKYSVLMNSPSISTALTMECTLINGNIFQILHPFDAVLRAVQAGESIGFAVALQSGDFAVTRFTLQGAKQAIDKVLSEAAAAKAKEPKPIPVPPILVVPQVQIVPNIRINPAPNAVPNPTPNAPQNQPQKPGSKDISI